MATGDIGSIIENRVYASGKVLYGPTRVIGTDFYICPTTYGSSADAAVISYKCESNGNISDAYTGFLLFNTATYGAPTSNVFRVGTTGYIYAMVYHTFNTPYTTHVVTFSIDPITGVLTQITDYLMSTGSAKEMSGNVRHSAFRVYGTVYVCFGSQTHSGYWYAAKSFSISDDGVTIAAIQEYEASSVGYPRSAAVELAPNYYAVISDNSTSGASVVIRTYNVTNAGVITLVDTENIDTAWTSYSPQQVDIINISGNVYLCGYHCSVGGVHTSRLKTIEISTVGIIGAAIDTDDTLMAGYNCYSLEYLENLYVIMASANVLTTFNILVDGTIGAVIDTLSFYSWSFITYTGYGNVYTGAAYISSSGNGFSIDVIVPEPTIETLGASDIKHDRATLWGNITEIGIAEEYGFDWWHETDPVNELLGTDPIQKGLFSIELTGLNFFTTYNYCAKIRKPGGSWIYGTPSKDFMTTYPKPQVTTEPPTATADHYIDAVGCLVTDAEFAIDKYGFIYGCTQLDDKDISLAWSTEPKDVGYDAVETVTGGLVAPLLTENATSGQKDVKVAGASGIEAGQKYSLADNDNEEELTVDHVVGTTVTMTTNLVNNYYVSKEARLRQLVTVRLRNLEYGKRYYYRFWAHNQYGYGYGSEICALTSDTINLIYPLSTASKGIRFCIPGKMNFPPTGMYYDTRHHLLVRSPDCVFINQGAFGYVTGKYVCERQYYAEATNRDLYHMSNPTRRTGTIIKVKYKVRCGNNGYALGYYHKRVISDGATELTGSYISGTSLLPWACEIFYDNPFTSAPWAVAEVDSLQMGISIRSGTGFECPLCDCVEGRVCWANAAVTIKKPTITSATSMKLHALVTEDEAEACTVKFQYGLTVAYGSETTPQAAVKGQHIYADITVVEGTAYHCRAAITTACGETFYSSDWEFGGPELQMAFGQSPFTASPVWTDVTSYLMDGYVKRGRMHQLDRCETGTAVFILNNASGNWWSGNTGGDFTPDVHPITLIRWRRDHNGMNPIYYGIIESFEPSWAEEGGGFTPVMIVTASDVLKRFAKYRIVDANPALTADATTGLDYAYVDDTYGLVEGQTIKLYDDNGSENLIIQQVVPATKVVIFTTNIVGNYYMGDNAKLKKWPAVLSGTRIHDIVLEIGWPLSLCSIDTGEVMVIEITPPVGGSKALDEMHKTAKSEDGNLFVAADGILTYHDALARTVSPYNTSQATLTDTAGVFVKPELMQDDEFTYNEVSISGEGISEQIMVDSAAQQQQGPIDLPINDSQIYNEHDAIRQCLMLVLRYKQTHLDMRCKALHIMPDADPETLYPYVYGFDLVTRITLQINSAINPAMIDQAYHIEGLTHRWNPRKGWRTTWQLWAVNRYRGFNTHHDAWVGNVSDVDYDTCHNAASGSVGPYNDDGFGLGLSAGQQATYAGVIFMSARIDRGVVEFNTASLSGFTVLEAYLLFKSELIFQDNAWKLNLVNNNGVTCPIDAEDYAALHNAATLMANEIDMEAPVGWKVFELNATGLAAINKTGITRFGLRSNRDVAGTDPGETSKEYAHIANLGYYSGAYQMQLIVRLL